MKIPDKRRSLHELIWPSFDPRHVNETYEGEGDLIVAIISAVRRLKSEKGISLKTSIAKLGVYCNDNLRDIIERNSSAIAKTCNVGSLQFGPFTESIEGSAVEGYSVRIHEVTT
jgi:valyl-tRNA synthetase